METIKKSKIMKRAWRIFKGNSKYSFHFSDSLKKAWEIEKENTSSQTNKNKDKHLIHSSKTYDINEIMSLTATSISDYYTSGTGRYYGD